MKGLLEHERKENAEFLQMEMYCN